jgi:hypothetical protein
VSAADRLPPDANGEGIRRQLPDEHLPACSRRKTRQRRSWRAADALDKTPTMKV